MSEHPNMIYVAKIISERKHGTQELWHSELDSARDCVLLIEQLGFLNKRKFWGNDNNKRITLE
jgi:hypothetical protein